MKRKQWKLRNKDAIAAQKKKKTKPIVCPKCGSKLIRMGHPNDIASDVVRYECSKCDTAVDVDMEGNVTVVYSQGDERYDI